MPPFRALAAAVLGVVVVVAVVYVSTSQGKAPEMSLLQKKSQVSSSTANHLRNRLGESARWRTGPRGRRRRGMNRDAEKCGAEKCCVVRSGELFRGADAWMGGVQLRAHAARLEELHSIRFGATTLGDTGTEEGNRGFYWNYGFAHPHRAPFHQETEREKPCQTVHATRGAAGVARRLLLGSSGAPWTCDAFLTCPDCPRLSAPPLPHSAPRVSRTEPTDGKGVVTCKARHAGWGCGGESGVAYSEPTQRCPPACRLFHSPQFVLEVAGIQGPVVQIRGPGKYQLLPLCLSDGRWVVGDSPRAGVWCVADLCYTKYNDSVTPAQP